MERDGGVKERGKAGKTQIEAGMGGRGAGMKKGVLRGLDVEGSAQGSRYRGECNGNRYRVEC